VSRYYDIAGVRRHLKGWRPDMPDPRDRALSVPENFALPAAVDLRPKCPPVVDQGSLGSCTANAGATAMAFLGKRANHSRSYSRLFLYAMTRIIEGTPLSEDSGAEIRDVMKALSTYGIPLEEDWPYDTSRYTVKPSEAVMATALEHKALMYYRCPNLYTLKASLFQGFPVSFGFAVPDNMMTDECANTGIVLPPARGESFSGGGHAVLAVGYDINFECGNQRGAVLCQNSWGTGWGIQGYFWLPMTFWSGNLGALATDCWTIRRSMI
jgi:C1A family cysteine protease